MDQYLLEYFIGSRLVLMNVLEGNRVLFKIATFEFQERYLLILIVLALAFTTAFIMRSYPSKYGFYLHEYDPYFNYRATKYLIDNGFDAYWQWHDTMSWYPEGRDIPSTSQSGLHIVAAFLYNTFGRGTSLLDFTIILPVILSSLTTIVIYAVVRTISGSTSSGLFAALLFAFSPPLVQRGSLGWFKSEPLGLLLGLLAVYLLLSAIKHREIKYLIPKALIGGLLFGFANASWGGALYFSIPIFLFFFLLPFIRKDTHLPMYAALLFVGFAIATTAVFPRLGTSFIFGLSGIALIGGTLFLVFSNILKKKFIRSKTETRNTLYLLIVFIAVAIAVIFSGLYHTPYRKYLDAINPFFSYVRITELVAEQNPPTLRDYFANFSTLLIFSGIGSWIALKRRREATFIFALIVAITGIYVSTGFVRLLVFAAVGIIIVSAIGLQWVTRLVLEMTKQSPSIRTKTAATRSIKLNQKGFELDKRIIKSAYAVFIIFLLLFPMVYPTDTNWRTLADIPPPIINGDTTYAIKTNDWLNALNWISNNTPKDAIIAAWWDYGYWITTLANRTTLADNATTNKTRIATIAKMFMENQEEGIKIAHTLKADYILTYFVAQTVSVSNTSYYILGEGGDESKVYAFARLAKFDENKYLEDDRFTPKTVFWNSTLVGRLLPLILKGYTLSEDIQLPIANVTNNNNIFHKYKPEAVALYSIDVKYPINSTDNREPLSLVYSSGSFTENNQGIISAVLIYKVNNPAH
jgi:dolichyl-diphosphooligosaccharide---protein glycosyltransferase